MRLIMIFCLLLLAGCATKPHKQEVFFEQAMLNSMADRGCVLRSLEVNRSREKLRVVCEPVQQEDF